MKNSPLIPSMLFTLNVTLALLWGCGDKRNKELSSAPQPPPDTAPAYGDAFVDSSIGDASYLNPLLASDSASGDINSMVFNGLVKYDRDLQIVPELAEKWEVLDGGLTIVFDLKKDVRWHDGIPFTAEDVKFTYEKLIDPNVKTPYSRDFLLIKKFEVLSSHRIRVRYKKVFAPALESWGVGIIPKHVFEKGDFNSNPANRNPVGTGYYRFVRWKTAESISLTANDDYFAGRPYISHCIYRIIPDQSVQFMELLNESIDAMGLTPDQFLAYKEFFLNYNKFRYPTFSYTYLGFNLKNSLFSNKEIRKAIAHAIDKQKIIDGVLLGLGSPATGPFAPSSWAYNPDVNDFEYDPQKTREILARFGWQDSKGDGWLYKDGKRFEFTLCTNQGNKMRSLCAEIIQQHLKKVGIKMNIRIIEWSTFIHNFINKRDFEAVILGWSTGIDPDQSSIWHSEQTKESQYNFVSYSNPDVDELLGKGTLVFDREKRREIYRKIHSIIHSDVPYIFLYYPNALPVIHKRFMPLQVAAAGIRWNFEKWYAPQTRQKYLKE